MSISIKQPKQPSTPRNYKQIAYEYGEALITAIILALILRTFVIQAFKIPSESMMDTLLVGDYLLVNKFVYGTKIPFTDKYLWQFDGPEHGDVVVFRYPLDPDRDFIKRCVAVEGDTIEVKNNGVYINGRPSFENFKTLRGFDSQFSNWGPQVVPPGCIFVMGDNRNNSSDSRVWGFLEKKFLLGKAMILYFSWDSERHLPRISRIGTMIY